MENTTVAKAPTTGTVAPTKEITKEPVAKKPEPTKEPNFTVRDDISGKIILSLYVNTENKTVADITFSALDNSDIGYKSTGRGEVVYFTMINDLKARDSGPLSGWCYYVNGVKSTHASGLLNGLLVPGVAGMRTVLMARWDPGRALELIESERVSFMIGPPTFFIQLMAARGFVPYRVRTLRLVSSGGAGVTKAFVTEASARLGAWVKRSYGSTEAPTVTTSTDRDSSYHAQRRRTAGPSASAG